MARAASAFWSVQHMRGFQYFLHFARGAGAGMVGDHAPALSRLVIDIGGDHVGLAQAFPGQHVDALEHAVHAGAHALHPANFFGMNPDRSVGEQGVKHGAYGCRAHQPPATRVHADNVVLVAPAGHELFNVATLKRLVKSGLGVVGAADGDRGNWGSGHKVNRVLSANGQIGAVRPAGDRAFHRASDTTMVVLWLALWRCCHEITFFWSDYRCCFELCLLYTSDAADE